MKDTAEMNVLPDMCALDELFELASSVRDSSIEQRTQLFISDSEDCNSFHMIKISIGGVNVLLKFRHEN